MRPIQLAVAGLHSFREKQEVDFRELCEGGVFGIFGPTGSGKSSLLDAMTLALYGKVERASNNTQGILNHAEDEVYVSFTFELGNANGTNRYKVERSFKRSGEYSLRTATCRIIEIIDEQSVVLADKMNDVNQVVQELIGLTIDDFTRAVVLPQGKFAEFLSLKGSERRQMLQRLFHLEKYGDILNQKLRDRYQLLDRQKEATIAEQTGLGDASKEALAEAKRKLEESEILLQATLKEFEKMELRYSEGKQIWEWQLESEKIKEKLSKLNEDQARIEMLVERIDRAKKAEAIRPYLEEFELAAAEVKGIDSKFDEVKAMLENAQVEYEKAVQQYELAKQARAKDEHPLIIKIEQFTRAQEIQREITKAKLEKAQLANEISLKNNELQTKVVTLNEAESTRDQALTMQHQLKESLKKAHVPVNQREQIQTAVEAKQKITVLVEANNQLAHEITTKQSQLKDILNEKKQLDDSNQRLIKTVERFFTKTVTVYDHIVALDRRFEMLVSFSARLTKELKLELDHEKAKQLAAHLAEQLKTGEACPVCGSTDHPNPVIETKDNADTIKQSIERLEQTIADSNEKRQELKTQQIKLQSVADGLTEILKIEPSEEQSESAVALDELQLNEKSSSTISNLTTIYQQLVIECKGLTQDVLEVQEESKQTVLRVRDLEQKSLQVNHSVQVLTTTVQELDDRFKSQSKLVIDLIDDWEKQFAPMRFEEVEKEQQQVSRMDREATNITEELDKISPQIEMKEKEINELKEAIHHLQILLATDKSSFAEKEKIVHEQTEKLMKQIGDADVDELLQEMNTKLTALKETEQKTLENYNEKQKILQIAEKDFAVTSESKASAKVRFEKATTRWSQMLQETPFVTIDEVKQAFTSKEEIGTWEREIQLYQDQVTKVNVEKARLDNLLVGRQLTKDEWDDLQAQHQRLFEKISDARERKGASAEFLSEIERKHARHNELETLQKELGKEIEKVGKLQTVFRGNAFIEYIAEEQLITVSRDASERLAQLTRGRYAIEVNSEGGFVIRDDANGGVKRPVSTLSGGETFLTSLALALSLSAQIQLRGQYPLEFFFLDEGFGTLDQDLLDIVISSLEKLHSDRLSVGVISHVQELRARLPRKLIVEAAEPSGKGSQVKLEKF